MFETHVEKQEYEVMDGCYGKVIDRCKNGVYLSLDNGEIAYAYKFGNLRIDTRVLCTVLKLAKADKRKLVSIDSVVEYSF